MLERILSNFDFKDKMYYIYLFKINFLNIMV